MNHMTQLYDNAIVLILDVQLYDGVYFRLLLAFGGSYHENHKLTQ